MSRFVQGFFTFLSINFTSLQIRVCEDLPLKLQGYTAYVMSATSRYKLRSVTRKEQGQGIRTCHRIHAPTYQPLNQGLHTHVLLTMNPLTLGSLFLCISVVCQIWPSHFSQTPRKSPRQRVSSKMSVNFMRKEFLQKYVNNLFIGEIFARLIGFYKNIQIQKL